MESWGIMPDFDDKNNIIDSKDPLVGVKDPLAFHGRETIYPPLRDRPESKTLSKLDHIDIINKKITNIQKEFPDQTKSLLPLSEDKYAVFEDKLYNEFAKKEENATATKNSLNRINELRSPLKGLSKSALEQKLSEIQSLRGAVPDELIDKLESSINNAITSAQQTESAKASLDEQTKSDLDTKKAAEMKAKSETLEKLLEIYKNGNFENKFKTDLEEDERRRIELQELLKRSTPLTADEIRRHRDSHLSEEQLNDRRHRLNVTFEIRDNAATLASYHAEQETRAERARNETDRVKHKTTKEKHQKIAKNADEKITWRTQNLNQALDMAINSGDKSEVMSKKMSDYFIEWKDQIIKEKHNLTKDAKIIKALVKVGLHKELEELSKHVPHLDLTKEIKAANDEKMKQDKRYEAAVDLETKVKPEKNVDENKIQQPTSETFSKNPSFKIDNNKITPNDTPTPKLKQRGKSRER